MAAPASRTSSNAISFSSGTSFPENAGEPSRAFSINPRRQPWQGDWALLIQQRTTHFQQLTVPGCCVPLRGFALEVEGLVEHSRGFNLAVLGAPVAAEQHFSEAVRLGEALDPEHARLVPWLKDLANAREARGDCAGAVTHRLRALAIAERTLGEEHQVSSRARRERSTGSRAGVDGSATAQGPSTGRGERSANQRPLDASAPPPIRSAVADSH